MFLLPTDNEDIYVNIEIMKNNIIFIEIDKNMFGLHSVVCHTVQGDSYSIANFVGYDNAKTFVLKLINKMNKYYFMKEKGELHC